MLNSRGHLLAFGHTLPIRRHVIFPSLRFISLFLKCYIRLFRISCRHSCRLNTFIMEARECTHSPSPATWPRKVVQTVGRLHPSLSWRYSCSLNSRESVLYSSVRIWADLEFFLHIWADLVYSTVHHIWAVLVYCTHMSSSSVLYV